VDEKRRIQDHALEAMPDAESLLVEDRLWWVRGRAAIIERYLERARRLGPLSTIVDVGCGSGGNLGTLARFGSVIGVEPSETLARRARSRGIAATVLQQDARALDVGSDVDLFTMFDVLEHVEADAALLARLREGARRGHRLLVSVPACPMLYGEHDRILHHHRRYTTGTLRSTLSAGGYHVVSMSYFMFFLFPFALLARTKDRVAARLGGRRSAVDVGDVPPLLSLPFQWTLRLEALLSQRVRFPIGLWLFALARSED
jgi:SAM-dependent methyltransferase